MRLHTVWVFIASFCIFSSLFSTTVQASLTDGLIVHYDFETITDKSVFDESHHNNNGTLFGSPAITVGRSGNGVHFAAQTDFLTLPQGVINSLTNFTITTWVNVSTLNGWSRIFDFGSGTNFNMFLTPMSGNNTLRFAIKNGGNEQLIDAPSPLKTNEWVHVAVTFSWNIWYNVGVGTLYVNGLVAGTNPTFTIHPSMLPTTTQNYIAKSQYPDPALNGTIDDFRMYNRTLSDVEIMEMNGYTADLMEAYNSIAIEGDLSKVQGDLVLSVQAGSSGIPVEWISSAPDVIAADGKVTRPKLFDQNVTLTAKISMLNGGVVVTMSKVFEVIVLASSVVPPLSDDESSLPLILIATNGLNIPQNNKIMADMKILNNPLGLNNINDTIYEYNGKVGIEIRGNTSAGFPKKSYTVETRLNETTDINVSLLGLPRENDWVFHGPYPDKSLMRNVLAYHLGNLTGKWSPRTHFFELFLNGAYQGVYALVEKIKIDNNRMNLAKLAAADTTGDELTGGYVVKIDRPESTDVDGKDYWISPYRAWTSLQQRVFFLFQDPDGEDLHPKQFNYIKQHITQFEDAMYSDNYKDKEAGYLPMVDFKSFVDYYIISELSRNLDGYRISTFLHKDKDSKGGKITMGPYWDYDICFGNANFFSAGMTEGWIIDGMGNADGYAMPFWWQKFRLDPYFNAYLKVYWNEWKEKYINTSYLNAFIDSCASDLYAAQKRNFQTWNILTTYLWPNNAVPGSYAGELSYLKNWLNNRITWMDSQIQAITDVPDRLKQQVLTMDLVTYPNPFVEQVHFKFHLAAAGKVEIRIHDLMGRTVYSYQEYLEAGLHEFPVSTSELAVSSPLYQYQVKVDGALRKTGKLIRKGN